MVGTTLPTTGGELATRGSRADSVTVETMKKQQGDNQRPGGSVSSALFAAGCCGISVIAVWAPATRAQLILSAVAILAVWFKPPKPPDEPDT